MIDGITWCLWPVLTSAVVAYFRLFIFTAIHLSLTVLSLGTSNSSHIFLCVCLLFTVFSHFHFILYWCNIKKIYGLHKPRFINLKTVCGEWDHLPRLWILLSLVVHDARVLQLPYAHLCWVCFVWVCVHHGWPGSLPLCLTTQARTRTQQLSSSGRRVKLIHLWNP